MTVAKASREEWESVMSFANELDEEIKHPSKSDEELGAWVRNAPCLFRVVFGYQVMVDNACDPTSDTLAFKPEIVAAMEAYSSNA